MTAQDKLKKNKGIFLVLWVLSIFSSCLVLPYVLKLGFIPPSVPLIKVFAIAIVQAALFFGVICYLSHVLISKTDLLPFSTQDLFKRIACPGMIVGGCVGGIIHLLERAIFQNSSLSTFHPPFWAGLLASFYGGINEEVVLRLFLFTLLYFLFKKSFRFEFRHRIVYLWITNMIVAIIFGLGHLPAAFKLCAPSAFEIFRVLLLNGISGIAFGWLYWSRGIWAAMIAHFVADLVIHVIFI